MKFVLRLSTKYYKSTLVITNTVEILYNIFRENFHNKIYFPNSYFSIEVATKNLSYINDLIVICTIKVILI